MTRQDSSATPCPCPGAPGSAQKSPAICQALPDTCGRSELGYVRLAQQRAEDAEKCMRTAAELEAAAPALPFCELPPALS